jgi:hypothetical protein
VVAAGMQLPASPPHHVHGSDSDRRRYDEVFENTFDWSERADGATREHKPYAELKRVRSRKGLTNGLLFMCITKRTGARSAQG